MKRPTMKDVSTAAKVSVFTVSRAMNDGTGVSTETREHVKKIARELGYIPNQLARGLKGGKTRTVGVLTANTNNLYYALLVGAVDRALQAGDYHCIVMDAVLDGRYRQDRESAFVEDLLQQQVAAVVLTYRITDENLRILVDRGVDLVFVDSSPPPGFDQYPSVNSDNYAGARLLGEHLASHRYGSPWAFVGFTATWQSRRPRQHGFEEAAASAGVTVEVIEGSNDADSAEAAVSDFISDRSANGGQIPRAIFAGNELLLQGTLKALREHNLRVPLDVAVVSYDEFAWASYVEPPLTVIDQKVTEVGRKAGEALLERLQSGTSRGPSPKVLVSPTLLTRRSCGC